MKSKLPKISDLRLDATGARGAFEEFCCQLFRRTPEVPPQSRYRRVRGDGGDGGVESYWLLPTGEVWGLQAKFFTKLENSQKLQLTESVRQATANYPNLTRYIICLPFNLTAKKGAKAGKPQKGEREKLSEWITAWKEELAASGRTVEFEPWDESEILGRLAQADATGGLRRYWFDQEILTSAWFAERLSDAKAQAGPRYSPELNVTSPLGEALHAFGLSESWQKTIEALSSNYLEKLSRWRDTAEGKILPISSSQKEFTEEALALAKVAGLLEVNLSGAIDNPELLVLSSFRKAIQESLELGNSLEPKIRAVLVDKHGENADSPGFRQFSAEYMASFPMAPLDHLRDLLEVLRKIEVLAFQAEGQLPYSTGMLIHGEAGIGKTHGILDAAVQRHKSGLLSLVLFGDDVTNNDPWQTILARLGLGGDLGRDAALDALNAAGEASGFPVVIFIDALNETKPDRRKWQGWLPPMLQQVKRRPFLKLCVSCREIYVREVMPPDLDIPSIIHNGFLGKEYEAQATFFQHYGLGLPAEPLLQEEFANPLFLRLICEAMHNKGLQALPKGREGIRAVINLLLSTKNERIAITCNYDKRENRVKDAMLKLAGAMATEQSRMLSLGKVRSLVDAPPLSETQSLFGALEAESLLSVVEHPSEDLGGEASYFVRFSFERIGDHLVAEHLLMGTKDVCAAFTQRGALHFLITNDEAIEDNAGVIEALSIQLPENHNIEILDALDGFDHPVFWKVFIAGLLWRNPQFITERTVELVREALNSNKTIGATFEVLLGLAARPEHPLNAEFFDYIFEIVPLLRRDPCLAYLLEESYSAWTKTSRTQSGVRRLIDIARSGKLENLPDEVGILWAKTLAWFCASPDRRIRDQATMALVNIFCSRPNCIDSLLQRFLSCDDEYIAERILVSAYGALLLNPDPTPLHNAASLVYNAYFAMGQPPLNAALRDHARLIIDLAIESGHAHESINPKLYRPPYKSPWPITLPSEEELKAYVDDRNRFPQMNLVERINLATGTDFARYIVEPRVVRAFDLTKAGLDKIGIFCWFLKRAVDFGYPGPNNCCADFDKAVLGVFGGGRGKPGWAERLGKKYYWIFLRQLVGQIADHVDRKTWDSTFLPSDNLQGLELRDIDPTDIRQFLPILDVDRDWITPVPYKFYGSDTPDEDANWVAKHDFTDVEQALCPVDCDGCSWQVLSMDDSWDSKRKDFRIHKTYRHVARSINTVTCDAADIEKVISSYKKGLLEYYDREPNDYRGYLGEYPNRERYTNYLFDPIIFGEDGGGIPVQYLVLRQLRGREWERDYSHIGESKTILMPSVSLIKFDDLEWNHSGAWLNVDKQVQIQDPWWWSSENSPALICRSEFLDRYLEAAGLALIILGFQIKFIAGTMTGGGRIIERTLFIRHQGQTRLIERENVQD